MGGLKEIRRRIGSIKSTRQITRAMKLVSAAKLKRAEEAAIGGRKFAQHLEEAIAAVLAGLPGSFRHPFLKQEEQGQRCAVRRVIVVSGDRGLCGAYNGNVIKGVTAREFSGSAELEFVGVGRRTAANAKRLGWKLVQSQEGLPDDSTKWPVAEMADRLFADFEAGLIGEVAIYYTKFISGLTQQVTREVLLPLDLQGLEDRRDAQPDGLGKYKYSPEPAKILEQLIPFYIKSKIRTAILESKASEHASRMAAMDSATNNAEDLIARLQLFYNRARQSAITTELIDIIGGAEALE